MSKGDALIERGAERLEDLSRKAAAKGGFAAKFVDELADDAQFLRKLKPSLIAARARAGQKKDDSAAPKNESTAAPASEPTTAPTQQPAAAASPPEPMVSTPPPREPMVSTPSTPPPEPTVPPPAAAPAAEAPTIEAAPALEAPGVPERAAPEPAKERKEKRGGGPNPLVIVGVAFAAGILLAKVVDWRGHAHPKD